MVNQNTLDWTVIMKTIGYARVSTVHQQLDSQLNALKQYGCTEIYTEFDSGRNTQRKELASALDSLESGDTFVIFKLDRLSRGTKHLLGLMEEFNDRNINFISIQNNIDTSTSMGKFFFTIMSAFAEMEAELIRERVLSGLDAAKAKGKILGRPVENKYIDEVINDYLNTTLSVVEIAKKYNISRPTVYNYLQRKSIPKR